MESKEAVFLSSILHLPAGISVISVHPSVTEFVVRIACQAPSMPCPECHQPSTHLHGMYQRTVADLPCAGRNVLLILRVRKFFCRTLTCSHKIFAERLPGLVESYGRMTTRLIALLQALGLGSGGQLGTRQAERSGIATTPSTLLRQGMQLPAPVTRAIRVLGVDDWSWKKHHRYGTLLVDLERHKIIDLLADRESATLERWLRDHPEVEIVSRDRGKDYAKAVTHAAPQAIQVVDRFHLVRNLSEALQKVLAHCRTEIRQQDTEGLLPDREAEEQDRPLPTPATWQQRTPPHIEIAHQARQ
ncbi:MAG TPA: ISL3 family transposase, partial [Ktedonobacteraceae bacterium]|nr:ISL3 family transposase [Ktedonobacteraceae bacterium]